MWAPDVFDAAIEFRSKVTVDEQAVAATTDWRRVAAELSSKLGLVTIEKLAAELGVVVDAGDLAFRVEEDLDGRFIVCRWGPTVTEIELVGGSLDGLEFNVPTQPLPRTLELTDPSRPVGDVRTVWYALRSWNPDRRRFCYLPSLPDRVSA